MHRSTSIIEYAESAWSVWKPYLIQYLLTACTGRMVRQVRYSPIASEEPRAITAMDMVAYATFRALTSDDGKRD